jgi:hypothetical protein
MNRKKLIETSSVAAGGVVIGMVAVVLFGRAADEARASRRQADLEAQIFEITPARELIVMYADASVIGGATKPELLNSESKLYYISRAKFIYSVDMRALKTADFHYDPKADVLKIRIPQIRIQADVYGARERLAALALLSSEGGSGNELERVAAGALERNALREASRPAVVKAAVTSAKYEIAKLYEDAFAASGRKTRVIVFANGEALS